MYGRACIVPSPTFVVPVPASTVPYSVKIFPAYFCLQPLLLPTKTAVLTFGSLSYLYFQQPVQEIDPGIPCPQKFHYIVFETNIQECDFWFLPSVGNTAAVLALR